MSALARRPALVAFALVSGIHLCWALAIPRNGGPDEPSHLRNAAAIARGQLLPPHEPGYADGVRRVTAPAALQGPFWPCFAFKENTTGGCQQPVASGGSAVQLTTSGKHPPLPYVPAGLMSFAISGYRLHYAMRAGHALAMAALVAWSVAVLVRTGRGRMPIAGLLTALTPTAMFMGGVVNPNGIEDAAGLLAWAGGLALVCGDIGERVRRSSLVALGVGSAVLVSSRTLSPLWLMVVAVSLMLAARPGRLRELLGRRDVQVTVAAVAAATVLQFVWIEVSGLLQAVDKQVAVDAPTSSIARTLTGRTALLLHQMIGQFGWYEVNASSTTVFAWIVGFVLVAGTALAVARRRALLAMAVVAVAYLAVPVIVDFREAKLAGIVWQGRYSIPLIGGVTILAGFELAASHLAGGGAPSAPAAPAPSPPGSLAVARSASARSETRHTGSGLRDRADLASAMRRLSWLIAAAFVVANVTGFVWALRRYMVGKDGTVWFWRAHDWQPPLLPLVLVAAHGALTVGLAWFVLRAADRAPIDVETIDAMASAASEAVAT